MALQIGDSLGRYRLEQLVGQGGMAVVYRAVDAVLGRTVAVKVIRPAYTEDPMFLDRFLQEARVVASLDHPNILPLYDFGEADGAPYLVLPYLPGGSLAERMQGRAQPLPLVAAWVIQLAGALDAAHARGVLHRDVKPGNVLVGNDGRLVLGDFGIARLAEATTRLTTTGMVVGTPVYMAPELARGGDATPASDRYALAVMVYEMLAGRPPFVGANPLSVLHQQVHEPVPSLAAAQPQLGPETDALLRRALAKDPAERPPSARAMAEELLRLLSPEQRAELSTLVWSGGGTGAAEAITGAQAAPATGADALTRALPPATPATRLATSEQRTRLSPHESEEPTRLMPRQASSPASRIVWGVLAAGVLVAIGLLLVPRLLQHGGAPAAASAAATPAGARAAALPAAAPVPLPAAAAAPAAQPSAAGGSGASVPQTTRAARPAAAPSPPARPLASPEPAPAAVEAAAAPTLTGRPLVDAAIAARGRLQLLRRPQHAFSADDFRRLLDGTSGMEEGEARGLHSGIVAVREWARGGLAYAEGRSSEAADARAALGSATAPWHVAWAAAVFADGGPWALAAFYADPRHELAQELQPQMASLGHAPRAALAAAWLAHLQGDHAGAVKLLLDAGVDPRRTRGDARGRALAAQLLAVESAEAGDQPGVQQWLPAALEEGRAPFARPFLVEMVAVARERLGAPAAEALVERGCDLGIEQLCKKEEGLTAQPAERSGRAGRRRALRGERVPPGGRGGRG